MMAEGSVATKLLHFCLQETLPPAGGQMMLRLIRNLLASDPVEPNESLSEEKQLK